MNAWLHDWRKLAYDELNKNGYKSVIDYCRSDELASFRKMAKSLHPELLAPIQIVKLFHEEAAATNSLGYYARSCFVRDIRYQLPGGFRSLGEAKLDGFFASWLASLDDVFVPECHVVADRLKHQAEVPDSWLPDSLDDPTLRFLFADVNW